jgi:hypothetical protein
MSETKHRLRAAAAPAVLILLSLALIGGLYAQQPGEASPQVEAEGGKIRPAPKNITEQVEICVFLAWIWGMILLLIFVLRHKIKEMDRLYEIRYFSNKGQGHH